MKSLEKQIAIRLASDMHEDLSEIAASEGRTVADMVRTIVADYLTYGPYSDRVVELARQRDAFSDALVKSINQNEQLVDLVKKSSTMIEESHTLIRKMLQEEQKTE